MHIHQLAGDIGLGHLLIGYIWLLYHSILSLLRFVVFHTSLHNLSLLHMAGQDFDLLRRGGDLRFLDGWRRTALIMLVHGTVLCRHH